MNIRRGESYPIYITLKQDGVILTPDMVADIRICIDGYHETYSSGGVQFDQQLMQWWVMPTPEETVALQEGRMPVCAHVYYQDGCVYIVDLGQINIRPGCCEEGL